MSDDSTPAQLDIVPRRLDLVPRQLRQLEQSRTNHQRFSLAEPPASAWTNYTNQRHVRDIALDINRGWVWLATWGGVLCWAPEAELCTRHTSEHGLVGNATRCIAVDGKGIVWAGGQNGGLCSLTPDNGKPWQPHRGCDRWTVLCLVPRPQGGVYAALRDTENRCALGEIAAPEARLRLLVRGGLETKEIETLLVDDDGFLWLGNAWGLHHYDNGVIKSCLGGKQVRTLQVRALAAAVGGGLWLGTNWGLYRFRADCEPCQETDWPRDEVLSLAVEPETSYLWVLTTREIGRIVDNVWQPVRSSPPGRLSSIVTVPSTFVAQTHLFEEGQILVGGANGLYKVSAGESEPAFSGASEDTLSNAVRCLWADEVAVWVGTARGLHVFDGETWRSYAPDVCDVRAILPEGTNGRLWAGSFRIGLQRLEQRVYVPDQLLREPIVSLTASGDGTLWAATLDTIYCRPSGNKKWEPIPHPAQQHIHERTIQTICYQLAEQTSILWVGTSAGLLRYLPALSLWDWAQDSGNLERLSIQALTIDPLTNCLWVGTPAGLFSEHKWQRHRETDVLCMAFAPSPAGTFWLGTATGLEQWPAPEQGEWFAGEPDAQFKAADSGLAADAIAALAVRVVGDEQEVWIGTHAGVSCYRYSEQ